MKHDTIMEGGPADYALVEGEAERVAKQAVEKLKESRQECWRPTSGVPSFTGINGARNFQAKWEFFTNLYLKNLIHAVLVKRITVEPLISDPCETRLWSEHKKSHKIREWKKPFNE